MAYALLSHTAATNNTSTVTTTGIDTTGATLIVIIYTGAYQTRTDFISDSATNTDYWTVKGQASSAPYGTQILIIPNPITSATHTFTSASAANSYPGLAILAFSGSFGGPQAMTSANTASGTTVAPGSITPAMDNSLLVTGGSCNTAAATVTISGGFTISDQVASGAISGGVYAAYLIQTSAAAANPTWTSNLTGDVVAQMVSFALIPAGGSAGTTGYGFAG